MIDTEHDDNLGSDITEHESLALELSFLFGGDIVEQACLIDIADLNFTDVMTTSVGEGIRQLKRLKHDPEAQRQWLSEQASGLRLLLCLWIMDTDILDKIQTRS